MAVLRVTRSQFDPARYDERLDAALAGAIRRLPGIQHCSLGTDQAAGKGIAVTVFDTLEHAQFSRDLLGEVIPRMQALGLRMEAPQFYEVVP